MITESEFTALLQTAFPDAEVALHDKTGMSDHFALWISTRAFEGKTLIQRNQMVYQALDNAMKDGRIHAVEIKTDVPV